MQVFSNNMYPEGGGKSMKDGQRNYLSYICGLITVSFFWVEAMERKVIGMEVSMCICNKYLNKMSPSF